MPVYLTPGVYRTPQVVSQELPFTLVRTDIAGFVGFAERGPLREDFPGNGENFDVTKVAMKITSWKQFQANFGGFLRYGFLAYAVRAFFENGGDTCYVVRVAASAAKSVSDQPAAAFLTLPAGAATLLGTAIQLLSEFRIEFKPADTTTIAPGDLVRLKGAGFSQINQVEEVQNGQIRFAKKLEPRLPSDSTVERFPAAFRIDAASRGFWGNRIEVQIWPLDSGSFALRARIDLGPEAPPAEAEFYRRLTWKDKNAPDYAPTVLNRQSNLIRIPADASQTINLDLASDPAFAGGRFHLQGGRDGCSAVTLQDFTGSPADLRGLRLLEEIDEIAILSVPDSVYRSAPPPRMPPPALDPCLPRPNARPEIIPDDPTAVPRALDEAQTIHLQQVMIEQCARLRYRVAVLDTPERLQIGDVQTWLRDSGLVTRLSRYAAIYYPWLKVPDALQVEGLNRSIPPSGHVAGAYAYNDLSFGVQRPPANVELNFATDVRRFISDVQQGDLNENNINAIRPFPGRGIRVWGARSLAPASDSDWRFIHVRRLMSAIEETIERYGRWVVFQNNDSTIRLTLKHSLEVMLQGIWAKGGLRGAKPAQAFFVKCDETNNPPAVVDRGQLICQIGIAVAAPMEFIVFEIRQAASGAQVLED